MVAALALLGATTQAQAQKQVLELDPAQSKVEFTLGDILHTVHGSFQFKRGEIQFDPATGAASGELVVDPNSGDSGNKTRDRKMKKEILETDKYPDASFTPQSVHGTLNPAGASKIEVAGIFTLHGSAHPLTVTVNVETNNGLLTADTSFVVPYVKWGLKDPSTFLLRVNKQVDIAVHLVGQLKRQTP